MVGKDGELSLTRQDFGSVQPGALRAYVPPGGHGFACAPLCCIRDYRAEANLMRICSLFPAATEIVFALGFGDALVGVSHECNYPPAASKLPSVTKSKVPAGLTSAEIDRVVSATRQDGGALYRLDAELLDRLAPDMIITQALCDVCALSSDEVRQCLSALARNPQLLSLQAHSLADILDDIRTVAAALGRYDRGERLVESLRARIDAIAAMTEGARCPRVFCMEWVDPPYCGGHWMKELVAIAGGEDALAVSNRPSYRVAWQDVLAFAPEIIVLTCCGLDAERASAESPILAGFPGAHTLPAIRNNQVFATDGSAYFARPGPRIVESLEILAHIIHPELVPAPQLPGAFRKLRVSEHDFA
jgi:iron complex transport system substrate-binding protein